MLLLVVVVVVVVVVVGKGGGGEREEEECVYLYIFRFPVMKTERLKLKYAFIYTLFRKYTFHFRPLYDPYVAYN